ncbi:carboxypeptidase regulatory-like domain-containing protein [Thiocystis violacea]|uniref:carboxypeptidase regulatory-like domain-containing protein n=1 Tax=Thiocystis violacea TaxID=13725 RepID=UPI0019081892|nr:carboxypeptidase regulatory-like domain-containing protein [Thiocystis violacea]MBK1720433.1 hypothetical protein [Thiocystis violacea]
MRRPEILNWLLPLLALSVPAAPLFAQSVEEPIQPEPRALEGSQPQWVIAPEGAAAPAAPEFPEGAVLSEGVFLPPGTVLPGGAILPGSPALSAPPVEPAPTPTPASAPAPLSALDVDAASGVPYISGGIGVSGREEMQEVKSKFNLRLLFAVQGSGAFLADVRVRIDDAAGPTLLTAVSQGPWFYTSLAPGRYILTVNNAGQVQTREVTVPETGAIEQSFYWAD